MKNREEAFVSLAGAAVGYNLAASTASAAVEGLGDDVIIGLGVTRVAAIVAAAVHGPKLVQSPAAPVNVCQGRPYPRSALV